MTRLTITFDNEEIDALRKSAMQQLRPTKDHARYILRSVLLGEKSTATKANPLTGLVYEAETVNGFVSVNQ